ncbi:hypothetical protein Ptr902_11255 [Pyrenophora tritici-repentis]|nr:hypothetical protein Ptr902_11255 [Pyrenophora tritici-repentis]
MTQLDIFCEQCEYGEQRRHGCAVFNFSEKLVALSMALLCGIARLGAAHVVVRIRVSPIGLDKDLDQPIYDQTEALFFLQEDRLAGN